MLNRQEQHIDQTPGATTAKTGLEVATFGGGCFWCLEAVYTMLKGVVSVVSGYAGGKVSNPTYREVCNGTTGHAEVVQVTFDPQVISFKDLVDVFFTIHDPTTPNRQGADVGTQYRSAIFFHSPAQREIAEAAITALNDAQVWKNAIVTEVTPYSDFYRAENYHQDYYASNPNQPYCRVVVAPKVAKARQYFLEKLKA
jgi:peptide-methionine (S)-S-oxide reductase